MTFELNNAKGMLVGLAVGDAVGTTNEFKKNPPPITDMVGGGPFHLKAGEWTDDTSMALCLGESLLEMGRFHYTDQLDRYVAWWQDGLHSVTGTCFDIGNTTRQSLADYTLSGCSFSKLTEHQSAGNGSLMRLAPIIIFYNKNEHEAIKYAAESSKTTHGAPQAVDACRYFTRLCLYATKEMTKQQLNACYVDDLNLNTFIYDVAGYNYPMFERADVNNPSGYVVDSLKAALYCFYKTDNFKDGCLLAANLGGDADTVAAIYGQLAGAFYGFSGIPPEWVERLAQNDIIIEMAECLYYGDR